MTRHVVLVGLMGCGKTTVGSLVAAQSGRALVDADVSIAAATGANVRELWESGGEPAYRSMESDVVLDALDAAEPLVVAAPGGVVLDPSVREGLAEHLVVWLRADPTLLATRVSVGDHRPLLGDDPGAALRAMSQDRDHLYRQVADAVIDIDSLDAPRVAAAVLALIEHSGDTP